MPMPAATRTSAIGIIQTKGFRFCVGGIMYGAEGGVVGGGGQPPDVGAPPCKTSVGAEFLLYGFSGWYAEPDEALPASTRVVPSSRQKFCESSYVF
jgi:hypothetical protein